MNKNAILFAAVAALCSGTAMAQSSDYRGDRNYQSSQYQGQHRGDNAYDQHADGRYARDRQDGRRGDYRDDRRDAYRDQRDYRRHDGYQRYDGRRGVHPRHEWRRGGYVSQEYRGNRYVVSDWRHHRGLHAPQRGYQWVQAGNDYLLVAIASGLIAQVLLNN